MLPPLPASCHTRPVGGAASAAAKCQAGRAEAVGALIHSLACIQQASLQPGGHRIGAQLRR